MKKKLKLLQKKLEYTAIAVTYAEIGEWRIAEDYLAKINELNKSQKPKIVVVSLDSDFSRETVEYSVNLAERMNFDILAVNAIQPEKKGNELEKEIKDDPKGTFNRLFGPFLQKAKDYRIRCEAIITINNFRSQIKHLLMKLRHVELVLVQVANGQELSLSLDVPVFQIETGRALPSPPMW